MRDRRSLSMLSPIEGRASFRRRIYASRDRARGTTIGPVSGFPARGFDSMGHVVEATRRGWRARPGQAASPRPSLRSGGLGDTRRAAWAGLPKAGGAPCGWPGNSTPSVRFPRCTAPPPGPAHPGPAHGRLSGGREPCPTASAWWNRARSPRRFCEFLPFRTLMTVGILDHKTDSTHQ
jgi:hypothetical protein